MGNKNRFLRKYKMGSQIKFQPKLTQSDPYYKPVLIIGQLRNLNLIQFSHVECKLSPRVTEDCFKLAVSSLHPSPATDTCSLYLDCATIAALPLKNSRHNTNSRAHAITRVVKSKTLGINESIVVVCERQDVFASGCAIARAFPLFSRKTNASSGNSGAGNGNNNSNNNTNNIINVNNCNNSEETIVDSNMGDNCNTAGSQKIDVEFIVIEKNGEIKTESLSEDDIDCLERAAYGIRLAARIVDTPCNEMNVSHFIEEIKNVANVLSLTPTIIRDEELLHRGFGGIYGVGKASNVPPALVILSHEPEGATETIALVGKGIVYDTGGLSIKGKTNMPGMKRDCGGAAAILGAFYGAVKGGFQQNLHAVFCLAENSVGPNATRPDDIHTLYSGRTVEINNTDAEGRLVLADGVAYAQKDLKANIILDMATLTGAQAIATGKYHAAILTNNEEWEIKALDAGRKSGDLLAPIVYCPELHFSEFASAVADMKNSVADRSNAQSSCAGLFIAAHIGFDFPGVWIHIDMATPVHCGERATGYGVALLLSLFGNYTNCSMLQSIAPNENEPPAKRCKD
ncbi:probable aminopeptidase NPEPL1 isoform X2 [Condylostylus longicornis]|uniref:probable aminopeptidase NPEPL1 isoform X2 n=1 Tax=Condylostylus longicornis TaxID=2530218 RepID=UPI00244DB5F7|nr:probable aminopeptidase NPEPL1 isoform X2 [Condylostylus longicornis]